MAAVAFMGLDPPEPWIFFAMSKKPDGTFVRSPHPTLSGTGEQMLTFRGGTHVMPVPSTKNVDRNKGVSTAVLFEDGIVGKLPNRVIEEVARTFTRGHPRHHRQSTDGTFFLTRTASVVTAKAPDARNLVFVLRINCFGILRRLALRESATTSCLRTNGMCGTSGGFREGRLSLQLRRELQMKLRNPQIS